MTARAPEHVRRATETHRLAMFAWCAERERACRGHLGGSDERTWRESHPAPRYADTLADIAAERRALHNLPPRANFPVPDLTEWLAS